MKAYTVIQPWATLLALGLKSNETRSWPTKHRGPVAIHAGKKIDKAACRWEPICNALAAHGYDEHNLPTGAVLATANLSSCRESIAAVPGGYNLAGGFFVDRTEAEFGDFTPGRFAWGMTDVQQLADPIPAKGQLGLWNFDMEAVLKQSENRGADDGELKD